MTLQIHELHDGQCRFVLNDRKPFYCCGEPVRDETVSYCPEHAKRCLTGKGHNWRQIADMIYAVEQTITRSK